VDHVPLLTVSFERFGQASMEYAVLLPQMAFVRKSERTLKDLTWRNIPITLKTPSMSDSPGYINYPTFVSDHPAF
jgi:hypothetical protein